MYPKCTFLFVISYGIRAKIGIFPRLRCHVKVIIAPIHTQFTPAFESASLSIWLHRLFWNTVSECTPSLQANLIINFRTDSCNSQNVHVHKLSHKGSMNYRFCTIVSHLQFMFCIKCNVENNMVSHLLHQSVGKRE